MSEDASRTLNSFFFFFSKMSSPIHLYGFTSVQSIMAWFSFVINTSSRPRSDKSRSVSSIIESTRGSLESLRVRVLRNDEIGFGGSGSTANMFATKNSLHLSKPATVCEVGPL